MNAGIDYTKALAQAQANANLDNQPRIIRGYGGVWWIDRAEEGVKYAHDVTMVHPKKVEDGDNHQQV